MAIDVPLSAANRWHSWLGHRSASKLRVLVPSLGLLPSLDWDSCQLSKHFGSNFQSSKHSFQLFDVIHCDI